MAGVCRVGSSDASEAPTVTSPITMDMIAGRSHERGHHGRRARVAHQRTVGDCASGAARIRDDADAVGDHRKRRSAAVDAACVWLVIGWLERVPWAGQRCRP